MFNFTTTTLINSTDSMKTVGTTGTSGAEFQIRRGNLHLKYDSKDCYKVYKKAGTAGVLEEKTIELPTPEANTVYRLNIYIKLEGSQNSYYSNSTGFRGKPFAVEAVSTTANAAGKNALADAFVANAKKYMIMVYENATVDLSASSGVITVKATDEFQRFTELKLEKWVSDSAEPFGAKWEEVSATVTTVHAGKEGFGTYTHLIKDYRLPTAANTRWNGIVPDEAPVLGKIYDQYTIYMTKDRGIMGGHAVGQLTTSTTCHVYFVDHDLASTFEAGLTFVGLSATTSNPPVTADPITGMISADKAING